jgi:ABC-type branched-subunit amino acid transport system ATPase component
MTAATTGGLAISHLAVAYGGNVVVRDVTLPAPAGQITGLIGPNGAGKTTIFNVCSGLVRPRAGTVHFLGHDITSASPRRRAQLGLGRSFQRIELCTAMTVRENIEIGCEARAASRNPFRQLTATRTERSRINVRVDDAMSRCGISQLAGIPAGLLSTGQRRLVELARVLASGFSMLLLDEPSSGLDEQETEEFSRILTSYVADSGAGILLVEHDMALVMRICDRIHVLDFGTLIFSGSPPEVQASPEVRAAYLGDEPVGDAAVTA